MEKANKTIEELINKTKFAEHHDYGNNNVNTILGVDEKNAPITFKFNDQRATISRLCKKGY